MAQQHQDSSGVHWFGEGASVHLDAVLGRNSSHLQWPSGIVLDRLCRTTHSRLNSVGRKSGDSRGAVQGGCRFCFAQRILESQAEALPWYLACIEQDKGSQKVHISRFTKGSRSAEASKFEAFNVANGYSRPSSEASLSASIRRSWLAAPKKQDGVRAYQIAPIHGGMCHPPQSEAVRRDLLEHLV